MTIPERLYRLAKGKIGEMRERFDNQDADIEVDPEILARLERANARSTARRELQDAVEYGSQPNPRTTSAGPPRSLRSPEEITQGTRPQPTGSQTQQSYSSEGDVLAPHYRLLGLEPGSDYAAVQAVYEKLASRCQPERFPAGSPEALEATDIRHRLEAAYKVLREALDPTARRFEMLEL